MSHLPFVHRAHPEVYARLLSALAEDPTLLARADAARRDLEAGGHALQNLSRHGATVEAVRAVLGDFAPPAGDSGPPRRALEVLAHFGPFEHFLREVGTSLKAPLVRPKERDRGLLRELADLSLRHSDLYRPAAKWLVAEGAFDEGGCRLMRPEVRFHAPSMRRFFAAPLRESEEEEYAGAGADGSGLSRQSSRSSRVVIYLVTVGPGWDEAASEYARSGRPYLALLSNALGAGAADTVAKDLNDHLDLAFFGDDATRRLRRLSPGYGDWPLSDQRTLVGLLKPEADLGVRLNEGDILIPEKSTSGLMAEKAKRGSGE